MQEAGFVACVLSLGLALSLLKVSVSDAVVLVPVYDEY